MSDADTQNAGQNGAPPPRPARQEGDWLDDRTPNDERFFPTVQVFAGQAAELPGSAVPSGAAGRVIRGRRNYTAITYGNLGAEAETVLNDKGMALPANRGGGANYANRTIGSANKTMANVLMDITKVLHYVLVQDVPGDLLENVEFFQANSRPAAHLQTSKVNFASRARPMATER